MNTVVAGADVSDRSRDAIAFARRLAPTELLLACAVPSTSTPPEGLDAVTLVIADGSPARALHTYADARHADLVVVGSSHTGRLGRVLPGSTGEKLLHGSPCAVAVVPRGHEDRPIERIGVAYDGSDEAKAALALAAGLAKRFDARLDLIVTGSRGYGPLHAALVGAVSGRLIRTAHCPVIVVPRGAAPALAEAA